MFNVETSILNQFINIKVTYSKYSSNRISTTYEQISIYDGYKLNDVICKCINNIKIENIVKEIRSVKHNIKMEYEMEINIDECFSLNINPIDIVFKKYHEHFNIRNMNILYKQLYNLVSQNVTCSLLDAIVYPDNDVKNLVPHDIIFSNYIFN